MTEQQIILDNLEAWEAFAADNRDALEESYGSIANAFQHAIQGGLTLGGGASPMFIVSFAD